MKKKSKWQVKREKDISKRSQFDPKIHELARQGEGFGWVGNFMQNTINTKANTVFVLVRFKV